MLHMIKKSLLFTFVSLALSVGGCGSSQSGVDPNDPIPMGTIMSQGSFTGQNGQTSSGIAIIYRLSSESYALRLSGVSLPEETGLQLIIVADSTNLPPLALRSSRGSQNYYFNLSGESPVFDQVRLHSIMTFRDYATAILLD